MSAVSDLQDAMIAHCLATWIAEIEEATRDIDKLTERLASHPEGVKIARQVAELLKEVYR